MSLVKNTLLYLGWIPALAGGGSVVWWLETDKTIEDLLRKTGKQILSTKGEFQKIVDEFEDNEEFVKDFGKPTWESVADWCKEKLALEITRENVKEVLPKAHNYCLGGQVTTRGISKFKNFGNIFNSLKKSDVAHQNMLALRIIHLGETEDDDVYYNFSQGETLEERTLSVGTRQTRKEMFARRLLIGKEHKILSQNPSDSAANKIWEDRATAYDENKGKKIKGLVKAWNYLGVGRLNIAGEPGVSRSNYLKDKCFRLLSERFYDDQSYNDALESFIEWCTDKR